MINGVAHGPLRGTTVCQLHMRHFKDGDELMLEPWRARGVPGDQGPGRGPALVRPHHRAGGYISVSTGSAPDGNAIPVPQGARRPGDGCGGLHRLRRVRGGVPERLGLAVHRREDRAPRPAAAGPAGARRARACAWWRRWMPRASAAAPISASAGCVPEGDQLEVIARMNRDYIRGSWARRDNVVRTVKPMTEWSTGSKLKIDPHATS